MKVAIITAIYGGIDKEIPIPEQLAPGIKTERFFYTEGSTTFPRRDFHPRLKAKFFKILPQAIRELKGFDAFIWIDGSFKITSGKWVSSIMESLHGNDIAVLYHPDRDCIYEEARFVLNMINRGNTYLKLRYGLEPIQQQVEAYKGEGYPAGNGLYSCGMFARWNNAKLNAAFSDWWIENTKFTIQDQISFPVVARRHGLKICKLGKEDWNLWDNKYFKLIPHNK